MSTITNQVQTMDPPTHRFSFSRMMLNAVPNFVMTGPTAADIDVSPPLADSLIRYQSSLPRPPYLGPLAFKYGGITSSETLSKKIWERLLKVGILVEEPEMRSGSAVSATGFRARLGSLSGGDRRANSVPSNANGARKLSIAADYSVDTETTTGGLTVRTDLITKTFSHKLAIISVHAQRKLIGLLFFWEDECRRLFSLGEEEAEIRRALEIRLEIDEEEGQGVSPPGYDGADGNGAELGRRASLVVPSKRELEMRLEGLRMRKGLVPSERGEVTMNVTRGRTGEGLPVYH